ncbi:hypothetical protein EMPS_03851 [Entomortierella parvispora]|uniref:F-box domain-containing protein n=1 Tax=Entomortierella parvispora TaxID=205924 RepID=A0A9P3LUU0_9FUNG|nr:hypothetical protein EMPS_03851 [Entomortierella parvispora]
MSHPPSPSGTSYYYDDTLEFSDESLERFSVLPPEVLCLLADHLSPSDLAACCQVCRGFRYYFEDYLFRDLVLVHPNRIADFNFAEERFKRHCFLTRSFVSSAGMQHARMLITSECRSLRRLCLQFSPRATIPPNVMANLLTSLSGANTRIHHITLAGAIDWTTTLRQLSSWRVLSSLDLDFAHVTLTEVAARSCQGSFEVVGALPALRKLSLANFYGPCSGLLMLLRECPNLEAVRFKLLDVWQPSTSCSAELVELLKNVQTLTWEASAVGSEELGEMLGLGSRTKKVAIAARHMDSLEPLASKAPTFRSLTLAGVQGPFGAELQWFLEKSTTLQELVILPSLQFEQGHQTRLLARNFHDRSGQMRILDEHAAGWSAMWGCSLTLTYLEVVIERLQPTYAEGISSSSGSQSWSLSAGCLAEHKVVYEQLGLLVNLRHLRLGVRGAEEHQTSSLLFSADTGLGPLGGMKSIQTLDLRWTIHEIGRIELDWFYSHWPRLKVIKGLTELPLEADQRSLQRSDGAKTWIQEHPFGVGHDYYGH